MQTECYNTGQLYRWKRQIERQEAPLPLTEKTVYDRLYAEFIETRQNKCSVNESDLRYWAINIAGVMGISNFELSGTWIAGFKQAHDIGSRKITKFVSRNYATVEAMIERSIKDFIVSVKSTLVTSELFAVYSADQSGFERKMRGKRTLSHVGEKHTPAAQSVSALTHFYTIMPVLSMDSSLLYRLYAVKPLLSDARSFACRINLPNFNQVFCGSVFAGESRLSETHAVRPAIPPTCHFSPRVDAVLRTSREKLCISANFVFYCAVK
jgi:hypothetical protein